MCHQPASRQLSSYLLGPGACGQVVRGRAWDVNTFQVRSSCHAKLSHMLPGHPTWICALAFGPFENLERWSIHGLHLPLKISLGHSISSGYPQLLRLFLSSHPICFRTGLGFCFLSRSPLARGSFLVAALLPLVSGEVFAAVTCGGSRHFRVQRADQFFISLDLALGFSGVMEVMRHAIAESSGDFKPASYFSSMMKANLQLEFPADYSGEIFGTLSSRSSRASKMVIVTSSDEFIMNHLL
ncbi:hypothetical protein DY000_02015021 [Brassica cretica]|uniref:Uncharacterized protein n=1 Tax=Brassica cretica TaxID=69181 RepID=A0ABQ7D0D2_BRACR|nr:hypothetical protein DY000_02015021 [Brassica cretica]